jgi:hypothetical protein
VSTLTSYGCTGFHVQGDEPAEKDDRWMVVDLMTPDGLLGQPSKFLIRPTVAGWKLVVGGDGMPVQELVAK